MNTSRIKKLQKNLSEKSLEALLIESPLDIFYLTAQDVSAGTLYITPASTVLIVDGRYYECCKDSPNFTTLLKEENTLQELVEKDKIASLTVNSETTTIDRFNQLKAQLPNIAITPLPSLIMPLRMVKDTAELDLLRAAGKLGSLGYDYAASLLKTGTTEKQVAKNLEIFWLNNGGEGLAFQPIIAFGGSSALPHYRAAGNTLKANDIALIDIGVVKDKYHSDMTRVCLFGTPSEELKKIYAIVQKAQEKALKLCKPGTTAGELDNEARTHIENEGYGNYFTHSLGHGIGLEIHEPPFLRKNSLYSDIPLQPGMAITIEPGIYLPGLGGVRLENTIIITETGYEDITCRPL